MKKCYYANYTIGLISRGKHHTKILNIKSQIFPNFKKQKKRSAF